MCSQFVGAVDLRGKGASSERRGSGIRRRLIHRDFSGKVDGGVERFCTDWFAGSRGSLVESWDWVVACVWRFLIGKLLFCVLAKSWELSLVDGP